MSNKTNMKKELTNEEIAKVFSMYCDAPIIFRKKNNGFLYCGSTSDRVNPIVHRKDTGNEWCEWNEIQFESTPLLKISDEDAIEVAKFVYTDAVGVMELIQIGNDYVSYNLCGGKLSTYSSQRLNQFSCVEDIQIFQYLISKGYAVPLFFAANHWANGKAAIELGIAIDATNTKK